MEYILTAILKEHFIALSSQIKKNNNELSGELKKLKKNQNKPKTNKKLAIIKIKN